MRADLPGVESKDISITAENRVLTLRGQRKFEKDANVKGWHRIERSYGEFVRSFALPNTVDTERVAADYKNGVLTVALPKKEAAKPRQVNIAVQGANGNK